MKFNTIAKKPIAICCIILLILSVNFSIIGFAQQYQYNNDGVLFDEFENSASITLKNCSLAKGNGSIILEYAPLKILYDHKTKPKNVDAWYDDAPKITPGGSGGALGQFLSRYITPDLLPKYEFENLAPIDKKGDSQYLETESEVNRPLSYTYYPIQLFEIKIDEDSDIIDYFNVEWCPGPYNDEAFLEEITMFLWSPGDLIPKWNDIGKLTYTFDNINNYTISSNESGSTYISDDGIVYILIVGKPDPDFAGEERAILSTDYIKIGLTFEEGYNPNGQVISGIIEPGNFQGWESIIWESSKPTDDTYVKLQILDENSDVIDSLDGNSNGFVDSPVDISSLDPSYNKIRLKAILHSDKFEMTPYLYKWVLLWQTTEGFFDSFNFSFRVDESIGINIASGNVGISKFYSEWPIIGKTPANTRSYVGKDIKYGENKTYWQTYINKDLAGWFRSPVMKDGRIYIGANDKKIYAFNLSLNPSDDESKYLPIDESSADYEIETGVAVGDEYVIVATGELSSTENKICALNKTDLSDVVWEYSLNNDKTICYTAAPTISNGRVYVTSWSGKYPNNPKLSYLFDKLNSLLGYSLLNNKLIALDENSGNQIWDNPISLPAGSLSTPAVDDGVIYVGCDNLQGPSVFAFNEYSGREIWNVSIGPVGRASPVVVDGEDNKIVLVLVRQQDLLSFNGSDMLFALNTEDGSTLWNLTIGNQSSILRSIELKLFNFTNLKATSQPAATPAVFGDTAYIMASNGRLFAVNINSGEVKWTFDEAKSITFNSASPIVVDDTVYIFTQDAHLYALDSANGEIIIDYETIYEGYQGFLGFLYGSPIITDGLVVVSILEWLLSGEFFGHLMCFGEYEENNLGNIYSIPIHVQKGKWWDKFNAKCENNEENNTITFSIIDESGKTLLTGLNGTNNDISSIPGNKIKLCAEINIKNISEIPYPLLNSWGITWSVEDKPPIFINSSFRAGEGQEGWVNLDIKECSIDVKDYGVNNVMSGIDINSAKYELGYITTSDKKVTKTFNAVCDGDSGDEQVKVIAKISELGISFKEIKNITFKIKDLAGNDAISEKIIFKIDSKKPTSEIVDAQDYKDVYTSDVLISAEGSDDKSGVANIGLYYRLIDDTIWLQYGSDESPYNWSFSNATSGYYEFCSVATDKAGNKEDFPDEGSLTFLFDMNLPSKPEFKGIYYFNSLPKFTGEKAVIFKDDFEINSIKYRLNFHGVNDWTTIKEDVGGKTYEKTWTLTQDDWDSMIEDKSYYIYFKITDIAGNIYETESQLDALEIVKDITPPVANVYFDLPDFEGGWDDKFTIRAYISEDIEFDYVVLEYSFSSDNKKWTDWEQYGDLINETPYEWEFEASDGNGYYKFKTKLYDSAGNYIESSEKTVSITIFPTMLLSIMIILAIILFLVAIYVLMKIRKKN